MATLRKGKCYSRPTTRAYTRTSKFKKKGFVKGIPVSKLSRFHMGDKKKDFEKEVKLIAKDEFNIRHNALESCRIYINKHLADKVGVKNFHFVVQSYPHQIMRENKLLSGARADRLQTGMKHSFGKPIGKSARVRNGTSIFSVKVDNSNVDYVSKLLKSANTRLPGKAGVEII